MYYPTSGLIAHTGLCGHEIFFNHIPSTFDTTLQCVVSAMNILHYTVCVSRGTANANPSHDGALNRGVFCWILSTKVSIQHKHTK